MYKYFMVFALVVLSLVVHATVGFAAVTGTVTDTKGAPVAGATVTFTNESNPDNKFSDSTDDQGKYTITISGATGVDASTPSAFSLGQNYPNPFNPTTTIPFTLNSSGHVSVSIYNIMGQSVATVIDNYMSAGTHSVTWNGMDDRGNHVSAGIYLYQLSAGRHAETKKMLLLDGGGSYVAKSSINIDTQSIAKIAAEAMYTITITHSGIIPYKKTGVEITDGQTMDFVVSLKSGTTIIEGITLVTIPFGIFSMGDIQGSGNNTELPVHSVTLSSFEMSIYEVTQGQYRSIMSASPSYFTGDDNLPVEQVSWWDAIKFCNARSAKAGLQPCYNESTGVCDFSKNGFRLPTEAEWEYACRAGKETNFYTGNILSSNGYTSTDFGTAGWYYGNSGSKTHPVGQKTANSWGLYDMHGNVWEWCNDWYGESYYSSSPPTDPTGPNTGSDRVNRGGGWYYDARYCRSADRYWYIPSYSSSITGFSITGFRVVRRP